MITVFMVIVFVVCLVYFLFLSSMSQVFGFYPYHFGKNKVIALTFDDGPNEPYTGQLLDILKENNVKATFFVCGRNAEKFPALLKRTVLEGHTVGNHLYGHSFSTYFKTEKFKEELLRTQEIIEATIGYCPKLYRSPWLMRTPKILSIVRDNGLTAVSGLFINWIETLQPRASFIAKTGLLQAHPGAIVIAHDGNMTVGGYRGNTVAAIGRLIPRLKQKGFRFVTVDQLLKLEPYTKPVK